MKAKPLTIIISALFAIFLTFSLISCGPRLYTVTFDTDGGSSVKAQDVEEGENVKKPENPTKEGYNFVGWFIEGEEWSFTRDCVNNNIVLKAKWEKKAYTVTFDAIEGSVSERERVALAGAQIGTLPIPKRENYDFLGWFEEDDTSLSNKITENTIVNDNMSLVARWELAKNLITVEFRPKSGLIDKNAVYIEKGTALGSLLVDPIRDDGATFLGWYNAYDKRVTSETIFSSNTILTAKWIEPVTCIDGTFNHNWSDWSYDGPTCTLEGKANRFCNKCGNRENIDGIPKLGHSFLSDWTYGIMQQSRICQRCKKPETIYYDSLKNSIKETLITGNVQNPDNVECLYNDSWTDVSSSFFADDNSPVTVDIIFLEATEVDCVFIKGAGAYIYTLSVLYEGDTEYTIITDAGSFGEVIQKHTINGAITKVRIHMPDGGSGDGYWQELAFAKIPEIK